MDDESDADILELNIVSIIIGVLVARIIWILINNTNIYVGSMVDIDPDDAMEDRMEVIDDIPGTLISISIILLLIVIIIAGYLK